ncbi:hypothetical protein PS029_21040, partial [Yersinia pestis]|nr:hypothetical protein [Yersinia pestis]
KTGVSGAFPATPGSKVAGDPGPGSQGSANLGGFSPFRVPFCVRFCCFSILFSSVFFLDILTIYWPDFFVGNLMRILAFYFAKFPIS